MILSIILVLATLFYVMLILKFRKIWESIPITHETSLPNALSIVVVFRNEGSNLIHLLNDILNLERDGVDLEILLIDDSSTDDGPDLVRNWKTKHDLNVRLETLNAQTSKSKKEGIELAMNLASHSQILLTDADCRLPKGWLKLMSTNNVEELKCGPVVFTPSKSVWSKLLQLELISLSSMSACTIFLKKPLLANGANLSYHKSLFTQLGGYELNSKKQSASGDDITMLRKVFGLKEAKISFVKNRKAIVETAPPATLHEFFHQRIRWAGKTKFDLFEPGSLISLRLIALYVLLFFVPFVSFFTSDEILLMVWVYCMIVKFVFDFLLFRSVLIFFNRVHLLRYVWLAEIFHLIYIVPVAILSMFVPFKWKGRKLTHG